MKKTLRVDINGEKLIEINIQYWSNIKVDLKKKEEKNKLKISEKSTVIKRQ